MFAGHCQVFKQAKADVACLAGFGGVTDLPCNAIEQFHPLLLFETHVVHLRGRVHTAQFGFQTGPIPLLPGRQDAPRARRRVVGLSLHDSAILIGPA